MSQAKRSARYVPKLRKLTPAQYDRVERAWIAAVGNPMEWRNRMSRAAGRATGRYEPYEVERAWGIVHPFDPLGAPGLTADH